MPPKLPTRLPLSGRNPRRLPFERRLRLWLAGLFLPTLALAALLVFNHTHSRLLALLTLLPLSLVALIAGVALFDQITRPLQTLANVVAALREDDFSFRARGARRADSLGDLALEINTLAGTLQHQRSSALDALTLVERVLTSMPSPVLAFDMDARLRLLNPAAAFAFHLTEREALGRTAPELHLQPLLQLPDEGLYNPDLPAGPPATPQESVRWSVRRTTFRLHGVPHTLFVLADVSSALREEERLAWQRLIRVLGHEINNSLTPIKSIAGSLRSRVRTLPPTNPEAATEAARSPQPEPGQLPSFPSQPASRNRDAAAPALAPIPFTPQHPHPDLDRGLAIIEDRADSLNRFLQAYQRLSRLPAPALRPTPLAHLAHRVAALETRLPIQLLPSPDVTLLADPDQLQQLLINLLRNAVDAALSTPASPIPPSSPERGAYPTPPAQELVTPQVTLAWTTTHTTATLTILDNGPGLTNPANLFVPFYTTKPGGSGIGLVLAQQIASAHRGALTLTNRPGQTGCQAEIHLPLRPSTA